MTSTGAPFSSRAGPAVEGHLRNLAQAIYHDWQREPFSTLALSGPAESAARLQELLHNDLRPTLAASHLDVDVASATASDLEAAITEVLDAKRQADGGRALVDLVADLREAAVQAALVQDAALIAFDEPQDELGPARPIAALLRF